ncbi:MAG: radical SAM protein [Kiritimatiellae bacterium]|nr:radical SAM protein [Kiritimatiellia bacterium]
MKVVFANPPVIRDRDSRPENDFRIEHFVFKPWITRLPLGRHVCYALNQGLSIGNGIRYGLRAGSRWPFTLPVPLSYFPYPFFMGYAAAYLRAHGHAVNILDAVAEQEYDYDRFLAELARERADIVVVECSTPTIDIDVWFANRVAAFAKVALAGPHLNETTTREIQERNPAISFYLLGEYILSAMQMAETGKPGVYASEIVMDLDAIPFPFRDYKSAAKYYDPSMPTPRPQLQVYGSKGCPFHCTFCSWPQSMYFGHVSLRSPEAIAREIREAVKQYGYRSIFFDDDTFNMGPERIARLCDHLKDTGLPWTMMGRLDLSPDWLFDKMVDSGCVGMRFGVETFNLDVLKNVRKGIERVDFRQTLEHLSRTHPHLMLHLTMMRDMPGQTDEDTRNDLRILRNMGYRPRSRKRSYQMSRCAPFPGTELHRQLQARVGAETLNNYKSYDGAMETVMKAMPK